MKIQLQLEEGRLTGILDEDGAPIEETIDEHHGAITWAEDHGQVSVVIDLIATQQALSQARWAHVARSRGLDPHTQERPAGVGPNTTCCHECGQWVASVLYAGHLDVHAHARQQEALLGVATSSGQVAL